MKQLYTSFSKALACIVWLSYACNSDKPAPVEPPSLIREKRDSGHTNGETRSWQEKGEGNFDNLIADYESKNRAIWQKPDMVISLLGNLEGKTVADIGAGTGYFSFRLVPKAEKVIAIEIDKNYIAFMDSVRVKLPEKYRNRFETRLAVPNDPLLKPGETHAVMIVNTYGYIENRVSYLKVLQKGMAPGASLLIIDFKKNNIPVGPPEKYKVALSQLEKELLSAGFTVEKVDKESLDYQYIVLAKAP